MIERTDILSVLESALGAYRLHAKSEVEFSCPFCSHRKPKLAVNVQTGMWHCWVCGAGGRSLVKLLRKVHAPESAIRQMSTMLKETVYFEPDAPQMPAQLPIHAFSLIGNMGFEGRAALNYLAVRGITKYDIGRYELMYCSEGKYAHRIIVPSYDETGKLNYFVAREYRGMGVKYLNPTISKNVVGFESQISWNFPIIVCEGVFDAIAIKRNAVPIFGKTLPIALYNKIMINGVETVYLALDSDAISASLTIAQKLIENGLMVYLLHLDGKDPAEIGFDGMQKIIQSHTSPLSMFDIVRQKAALI